MNDKAAAVAVVAAATDVVVLGWILARGSLRLDEGGALCRSCRRGTAVSPDALLLLQQILGGRLATALDAPASPATVEVEVLATRALEHHLERRLRSFGVLEQA